MFVPADTGWAIKELDLGVLLWCFSEPNPWLIPGLSPQAPKTRIFNSFTHENAENSVPLPVLQRERLPVSIPAKASGAGCLCNCLRAHCVSRAHLLCAIRNDPDGFTLVKGKNQGKAQKLLDSRNPATLHTTRKNKICSTPHPCNPETVGAIAAAWLSPGTMPSTPRGTNHG